MLVKAAFAHVSALWLCAGVPPGGSGLPAVQRGSAASARRAAAERRSAGGSAAAGQSAGCRPADALCHPCPHLLPEGVCAPPMPPRIV